MIDAPTVLVCWTTVSEQQQARTIAQALLERRVAACVQIDGPIESHYCWDGRVCCETEYRLVIKTSAQQQTRLKEVLRALHPYEVPQIVTVRSVDADRDYARWVDGQTG
ncbi:divalent-cation tolerance protein CutA [Stieleria sp. ICT_E10.1]|uniref:divalent-cation tolerance protein CutA n=1 Tax=Stieleria sedimenti TaxID=2976331 RepID=UPI00217FE23D|nr:divalent-cation tolerance protein CutA [Stieleria sedimenti]MCS7469364.1 divalent-cation tolerance protein CutA [Stieleria sedimenti]